MVPRERHNSLDMVGKTQQNPKENISCTVKRVTINGNIIIVVNIYQVLSIVLA